MDLAAEKESFERHGLPFILTQPSPLGLFSRFRKALTGAVTEISETWLNVRPGSWESTSLPWILLELAWTSGKTWRSSTYRNWLPRVPRVVTWTFSVLSLLLGKLFRSTHITRHNDVFGPGQSKQIKESKNTWLQNMLYTRPRSFFRFRIGHLECPSRTH